MLDNLEPFKEREGEGRTDAIGKSRRTAKTARGRNATRSALYGVNVILAHNGEDKSPVIFETTPIYANLFGTIQRAYDARGGWTTDFMDLRGGSLLRADGGFLIMYSLEALSEPGVWRASETHDESQSPGDSAAGNVLSLYGSGAEAGTRSTSM